MKEMKKYYLLTLVEKYHQFVLKQEGIKNLKKGFNVAENGVTIYTTSEAAKHVRAGFSDLNRCIWTVTVPEFAKKKRIATNAYYVNVFYVVKKEIILPSVIDRLIKECKGFNINDAESIAFAAIKNYNHVILDYIMDNYFLPVEFLNKQLKMCITSGRFELIKIFLKHNVKPDYLNNWALKHCEHNQYPKIAEYIINNLKSPVDGTK